jgi:outer membrane protein assembly factor BamB
MRCFSLTDGTEIWRYQYPVAVKRNHGMSRTVPSVTEKYVIGFGPKCHLTCLEAATGTIQWQRDLVKEFHAKVPPWYAGQCPLIEGDRLIVGTGGDALLVAMDVATGDIIWKSPNPQGWRMTHVSVLPVDYQGTHLYVYCGTGGVAGVSAEDGSILWATDAWKIGIATVATPLNVGEGLLFLSGGYNAGSMFLQFRKEGEAMVTEVKARLDPDVFGSTQQTPILYESHIYGVRPDGQLVCLDLQGKTLWTSGADRKFGLGPYLIADGMIFVLDDEGLLTLARATEAGYQELAQADVLDGHEAWAPMALAGTRLLLRDFTRMVCLELKER